MSLPFYTGQIPTADDFNALAVKADLAASGGASQIGYGLSTVADALAAVTAPPVISVAGKVGAVTLTHSDVAGVAQLQGDATQNFSVKNATGAQHAVPLAQADSRYAPLGGVGTGTVTSVGLSLPAELNVTGSPVTSVGTLTAGWASQTATTFFAAPTGAPGTPVFRALVPADVPVLNQNTTGTAANVTGVVAIAKGGTGQITQQAAINALTAVAGTTNEFVLTKDTATGNAIWKASAGGGGSFIAAGSGAVTRTMQNKARDFVSVLDFGADPTASVDSSPAFQNALNALPSGGGKIVVPEGNYIINSQPSLGSKSVYWDISVGTVFTGTATGVGQFPYVRSVGGQKSVGPLIQSQSMQNIGTSDGGIAAFQVEMLQPDTYGSGNSLAMYLGATSNNPNVMGNSWALNTVINVGSAAKGVHQCIEVDVDCFAAAALVKGISISGLGTQNPDVAIEIVRAPVPIQTYWDRGIDIIHSTMGIQIRDSCSGGISINAPNQTLNTPIGAKQRVIGGDTIILQRLNDSTTGHYLRGVNATNTANRFTINGNGDSYFQLGTYAGLLSCTGGLGTTFAVITAGAFFVGAGQICLGNTITPIANSGGLSLPAGPANYWAIIVGGTIYKIPLYAD